MWHRPARRPAHALPSRGQACLTRAARRFAGEACLAPTFDLHRVQMFQDVLRMRRNQRFGETVPHVAPPRAPTRPRLAK